MIEGVNNFFHGASRFGDRDRVIGEAHRAKPGKFTGDPGGTPAAMTVSREEPHMPTMIRDTTEASVTFSLAELAKIEEERVTRQEWERRCPPPSRARPYGRSASVHSSQRDQRQSAYDQPRPRGHQKR